MYHSELHRFSDCTEFPVNMKERALGILGRLSTEIRALHQVQENSERLNESIETSSGGHSEQHALISAVLLQNDFLRLLLEMLLPELATALQGGSAEVKCVENLQTDHKERQLHHDYMVAGRHEKSCSSAGPLDAMTKRRTSSIQLQLEHSQPTMSVSSAEDHHHGRGVLAAVTGRPSTDVVMPASTVPQPTPPRPGHLQLSAQHVQGLTLEFVKEQPLCAISSAAGSTGAMKAEENAARRGDIIAVKEGGVGETDTSAWAFQQEQNSQSVDKQERARAGAQQATRPATEVAAQKDEQKQTLMGETLAERTDQSRVQDLRQDVQAAPFTNRVEKETDSTSQDDAKEPSGKLSFVGEGSSSPGVTVAPEMRKSQADDDYPPTKTGHSKVTSKRDVDEVVGKHQPTDASDSKKELELLNTTTRHRIQHADRLHQPAGPSSPPDPVTVEALLLVHGDKGQHQGTNGYDQKSTSLADPNPPSRMEPLGDRLHADKQGSVKQSETKLTPVADSKLCEEVRTDSPSEVLLNFPQPMQSKPAATAANSGTAQRKVASPCPTPESQPTSPSLSLTANNSLLPVIQEGGVPAALQIPTTSKRGRIVESSTSSALCGFQDVPLASAQPHNLVPSSISGANSVAELALYKRKCNPPDTSVQINMQGAESTMQQASHTKTPSRHAPGASVCSRELRNSSQLVLSTAAANSGTAHSNAASPRPALEASSSSPSYISATEHNEATSPCPSPEFQSTLPSLALTASHSLVSVSQEGALGPPALQAPSTVKRECVVPNYTSSCCQSGSCDCAHQQQELRDGMEKLSGEVVTLHKNVLDLNAHGHKQTRRVRTLVADVADCRAMVEDEMHSQHQLDSRRRHVQSRGVREDRLSRHMGNLEERVRLLEARHRNIVGSIQHCKRNVAALSEVVTDVHHSLLTNQPFRWMPSESSSPNVSVSDFPGELSQTVQPVPSDCPHSETPNIAWGIGGR